MFGAIPIDVYVGDVLDVYNCVGVLTDVCGYCTSCSWVSQMMFVAVPADAVTVLVDWA